MFILDTNILIYYIAGDSKVINFVLGSLENGEELGVPAISVLEFMSFAAISDNEKLDFVSLMGKVIPVVLDFDQSFLAAKLRKKYRIQLADSAIAASVIQSNAILVSRDKGFKKIKEIEVIYL